MGEAVEHFSYDAVGNRLTDAKTGTNTWGYNKNNELQSFDTTSFKYNLNGQLTEKTVAGNKTTFSYNLDGRLKEIKDNSNQVIAQYEYDPFGRRTSKTLPQESKVIYFHYAAEGLVGEYAESGNLIQTYGYIPDSFFTSFPLFSYRTDFTEAKGYGFYITDFVGAPQKLITNTGRIVWEAHSDSYGKRQITKNEFINPLDFPGQYVDDESGLRYNYKRYYDPELGRYIKSDPIGLHGGINSYGYVYGNPIVGFDSTGEWGFLINIIRAVIQKAIRLSPRLILRKAPSYAMQGPRGSCPPSSPVGGGRTLPPPFFPTPPTPSNPPGGQNDPSPFPNNDPVGAPGMTPQNASGSGGTPPNVSVPWITSSPASPVSGPNIFISPGNIVSGPTKMHSRLKNRPRGFLPGDTGAAQWGVRNGVGAKEGKHRFHKGIKQGDKMSGATDDYWTNPETGDVIDPSGDYVGNLEDDY